MRYNLFLDDRRTPTSDPRVVNLSHIYKDYQWVTVRTFDEFTQYITKFGIPQIVSFDHDLGDVLNPEDPNYHLHNEKTGNACARWLAEYCIDNNLQLPTYLVHSSNPGGKENIDSIFLTAKKILDV